MCERRADGESRNAPQFRVQSEEITSQGRGANTFPPQRRSRPRRISRAHDNQARAYRAFSVSQSVLRTVPMWRPPRKAGSSCGVTILALDSAYFRIAFARAKTSL